MPSMEVNYFQPRNGPNFLEVREAYVSHFFTIRSNEMVQFAGFGGDKPLGEPLLPSRVESVFDEAGVKVMS